MSTRPTARSAGFPGWFGMSDRIPALSDMKSRAWITPMMTKVEEKLVSSLTAM